MPLPPQVPEIGALDLLLSVARLGSLGRAAREHGISQPAASARIRHLEGLLRTPLIERSTLGSCLTAHGAMVADWAQAVVSAAAALNAGVCALRSQQGSRIRIACRMTIAEYVLPPRLVELRRRRPDSVIGMRVVNSATVENSCSAVKWTSASSRDPTCPVVSTDARSGTTSWCSWWHRSTRGPGDDGR